MPYLRSAFGEPELQILPIFSIWVRTLASAQQTRKETVPQIPKSNIYYQYVLRVVSCLCNLCKVYI